MTPIVKVAIKMIKQDLITNNKVRPKIKLQPKFLTIHSTGNLKSTAKNERDWLMNKSNTRIASWHVCVDENEAIQAIPFNEVAYHAGSNKGNTTSISLEICESGNREKTLRKAIEITAYILEQYGWTIDNLKQHYDWNGKNCPSILRDTGRWEWFKNEVKKEMEKVTVTPNVIEFKGKEIKSIIIDGVTYAPIREVGNLLNLQVVYNNATKRVTLK